MTPLAAVLRALAQCGGYLVPQSSLLAQVRIECVPPPTTVEFTTALSQAEARGYIISHRPELGGEIRWRITDGGQAALTAAAVSTDNAR